MNNVLDKLYKQLVDCEINSSLSDIQQRIVKGTLKEAYLEGKVEGIEETINIKE